MFGTNREPNIVMVNTISKRTENELPLEPRHLGVPSGASEMISEPMVCSVQTMHLSCAETNIVSKRTKSRFHRTHVTSEYHQVGPK